MQDLVRAGCGAPGVDFCRRSISNPPARALLADSVVVVGATRRLALPYRPGRANLRLGWCFCLLLPLLKVAGALKLLLDGFRTRIRTKSSVGLVQLVVFVEAESHGYDQADDNNRRFQSHPPAMLMPVHRPLLKIGLGRLLAHGILPDCYRFDVRPDRRHDRHIAIPHRRPSIRANPS